MAISSYRDLDCWQIGVQIAREAYLLTKSFPREEAFGLTSQIRRAATSIPANIAAGHGRESTPNFVRFLRIAQGGVKELETHAIVSTEVNLVTTEAIANLLDLCDREGRMLRALIRSLSAQEK